jgi:ATP-dependent Clp protease ATP-binding subunit ClpA
MFRPLNQIEIDQVTQIMIKELTDKMSKQDIFLIIDPKVTSEIANKGFSVEFGARPLRRYIQDNLEDIIAKKILNNEIQRGDKVNINIDSSSNLVFNKVS